MSLLPSADSGTRGHHLHRPRARRPPPARRACRTRRALARIAVLDADPDAGDDLAAIDTGYRKLSAPEGTWRVVYAVDADVVTICEIWVDGVRSTGAAYAEALQRMVSADAPDAVELAGILERLGASPAPCRSPVTASSNPSPTGSPTPSSNEPRSPASTSPPWTRPPPSTPGTRSPAEPRVVARTPALRAPPAAGRRQPQSPRFEFCAQGARSARVTAH